MLTSIRFEVRRLLRYVTVGALNTIVSYVVYALFLRLHSTVLALALGYLAGMAVSYTLNYNWTFASIGSHGRSVMLRFALVNIGMLTLSEFTLAFFLRLIQSPYFAQLVNTVPSVLLGFVLNRWLVFGQSPTLRKMHLAN